MTTFPFQYCEKTFQHPSSWRKHMKDHEANRNRLNSGGSSPPSDDLQVSPPTPGEIVPTFAANAKLRNLPARLLHQHLVPVQSFQSSSEHLYNSEQYRLHQAPRQSEEAAVTIQPRQQTFSSINQRNLPVISNNVPCNDAPNLAHAFSHPSQYGINPSLPLNSKQVMMQNNQNSSQPVSTQPKSLAYHVSDQRILGNQHAIAYRQHSELPSGKEFPSHQSNGHDFYVPCQQAERVFMNFDNLQSSSASIHGEEQQERCQFTQTPSNHPSTNWKINSQRQYPKFYAGQQTQFQTKQSFPSCQPLQTLISKPSAAMSPASVPLPSSRHEDQVSSMPSSRTSSHGAMHCSSNHLLPKTSSETRNTCFKQMHQTVSVAPFPGPAAPDVLQHAPANPQMKPSPVDQISHFKYVCYEGMTGNSQQGRFSSPSIPQTESRQTMNYNLQRPVSEELSCVRRSCFQETPDNVVVTPMAAPATSHSVNEQAVHQQVNQALPHERNQTRYADVYETPSLIKEHHSVIPNSQIAGPDGTLLVQQTQSSDSTPSSSYDLQLLMGVLDEETRAADRQHNIAYTGAQQATASEQNSIDTSHFAIDEIEFLNDLCKTPEKLA